ncbi:hypothetical protein F4808DRAFT_436497 [Astrocystis sublimbata]|nr:hypothetical protein F4808DRAFT_436497 [Astrocystis sublimbata]
MWRPFYLQLWGLFTFCVAFIVLIAALEILFVVSYQNQGLATVDKSFHYAWTYGPTAVFTIATLTWDRVAFQTQMMAPWYRMKKSPSTASESLLLDYLDMLPPFAIMRALKLRDWAPAAALSISLVLSLVIALSTSLIQPHLTRIETSVPLELNTQFRDVDNNLTLNVDVAYLTMAGLSELQLLYPEGTTAQYAHQTLADPPMMGTGIQLNVDAFAADLDCEMAELEIIDVFQQRGLFYTFSFNITLELRRDDCAMRVNTEVGTETPRNFTALNFVRMLSGSCGGNSPSSIGTGDAERASIIVGRLTYEIEQPRDPDNTTLIASGMRITDSVQAICMPRYAIRKAAFVQNGTLAPDIGLAQESHSRTLPNVEAWDLMQAQINAISAATSNDSIQLWERDVGNGSAINFDGYSLLARSSELHEVPFHALTDATLWLGAIPRYFQKFSAQIAKSSFMVPASTTVTGTRTRDEDRLMVTGIPCRVIEALLSLCTVLCMIIAATLPRNTRMESNPVSILGTIWTATEAKSVVLRLQNHGLSEPQVILQQLSTAAYSLYQPRHNVFKILPHDYSSTIQALPRSRRRASPDSRPGGKYALMLHPASRALFLFLLGGMIVILQILLMLSNKNDGLGSADIGKNLQYSWTVVPSLLFTAIALSAGAIDSATRSLVPFVALKRGGSLSDTIAFDLLDGSRPRLFLKGLKTKSWAAVFTIFAFLVSSTFTIFSGSLYMTRSFPTELPTTLTANTTFGPLRADPTGEETYWGTALAYSGGKDAVASSLILERNGSFQPFTYQDLAFPSLVLGGPSLLLPDNNEPPYLEGMTTVANVPALRARLQCKLYSGEQIRKNLTLNYVAEGESPKTWNGVGYRVPNPLRLDIDEENCLVDNFTEFTTSTIMVSTLQEGAREGEMTFGVSSGDHFGDFNRGKGWVGGCGVVLYAWGHVAVDADGQATVDAFALGCNETIEAVDVSTHFNGSSLVIDKNNPPVPNEDSARPAPFQVAIPHEPCYNSMLDPKIADSAQEVYDNFFALLTSSRWAVPASDLANTNTAAVDRVIAAIKAQHGLVRANTLDTLYRVHVNDSYPEGVPSSGSQLSPDTFLYIANATVLPGTSRVVQDTWSTRVLQTLLAVTLVLSAATWALMPRADVMVGSPTSIARKLALAAGGNLFEEVLPLMSNVEDEHREMERSGYGEDCMYVMAGERRMGMGQ